MKKKILLVSILLFSCFFIQKVSAISCSYKAIMGAWLNDGKGYHDEEGIVERNFREATLSLEVSLAGITGRVHYCPKDKMDDDGCTEFSNKVKIDNSKIQNYFHTYSSFKAKAEDYTQKEECPPYFVTKTGENNDGWYGESWVAKDKSEMKSLIEYRSTKEYHASGYIFGFEQEKGKEKKNFSATSCLSFKSKNGTENFDYEDGCTTNTQFSCIWNIKNGHKYCNYDDLTYIKCGGAWDIPEQIPSLTSFFINALKIATPIILIFISIVSLVKAVAASNEDEIKKAQSKFVKRLIAAVIVFFVIQITQFVVIKVADEDDVGNIKSCLKCFLNNTCDTSTYYKTNVLGDYYCTFLSNSKTVACDENPKESKE